MVPGKGGNLEQRRKTGALVVYGPGGGSHIGLVESVSGSGINDYVSIEGNTSGATGGLAARKQYGNRRSDVYGFCYIDYPVTTISVGSGTAISGTTVNIPSSVPQTGITGNYTCYPQFTEDGMQERRKEEFPKYGDKKERREALKT